MYPELSREECSKIYNRLRGKNLPMIEESMKKVEDQAWGALKNNEYEKADKCFKMVIYIKAIIPSLARSF